MNINIIKRRFLALNKDRLERINKSLRWRQRDFLNLLPLLLHINDESLPGYVGATIPAGISGFIANKDTIAAAKRINKNFIHRKQALRRYDLISIFLTGSSGTITQSDESDFDIWLCYRPDLDAKSISLLEKKAEAIRQWCEALELEVHFFLMNEQRFTDREYTILGKENSGTAQHNLLLEEFYRTGILLAGRFPLWWLIPPEEESEYIEYKAKLLKQGKLNEYEFIDFGPICSIPAEEFFGASLWQIYKGIDSPYKSVLKILLMEAYANEYPDIELLCNRLKKAVYENKTAMADIDPYIMMCYKVEEYLLQRNEPRRLELARRCFYFKSDIQLSRPVADNDPAHWRYDLLGSLVNSWGWDDAQLLMLDSRSTWKVNRVLDERRVLVDELTRSYKLLSGFARKYADAAHINTRDMNVLGRKLYAAFERKAGKIETINPNISPNLYEKALSFHELNNTWLLFRGKVGTADLQRNKPLKRAKSIIELLCWCHFNRITTARTILSLYPQKSRIKQNEIKKILATLESEHPGGKLPECDMDLLNKASYIINSLLFINVGIDPMFLGNNNGRQIVSNRTNALSYSGYLENLVISIDQVSITSWHEIYTHTYTGISEILDCLCRNVRMSAQTDKGLFPLTRAYSFSSAHDWSVSGRVEELFTNVIKFFHHADVPLGANYILGVEGNFYLLYKNQDSIGYRRLGNYDKLLIELNTPRLTYSPVIFDKLTLADHFLPLLYAHHTAGELSVFIQIEGKQADIYILDENGSLFTLSQDFYSLASTMAQLDNFFYAVHQRMRAGDANKSVEHIEYYSILRDKNSWSIRSNQVDPLASAPNSLDVTVIIESVDDQPGYRVFCNDQEFSSLEYREHLFDQVATHILSLRTGNEPYSLYITDIDLPQDSIVQLQTIHYLQYKTQFEQHLNQALLYMKRQADQLVS